MDKSAIRKFARWARTELITRVTASAVRWGIEKGADPDAWSVNDHVLTEDEKTQRKEILRRMEDRGREALLEEAAWTWFNRFIALRFMEVNGCLPSRVRLFTDENGTFRPKILDEALDLDEETFDPETIADYKQQYYVENNHEAIISPQVFDWVQEEIKRRREGRGRYSGVSIFSSKIKCGQCGGWYGAKVWHSTDKYRRTIYRCNDKFKSHCKTPHLTEDDIKEAFVRAVNQLIENKADVLDSITLLKERLTDTEDLEEERDRISTDLNLLADKIQQLIAENARVAQNQDDYDRNYNELVSRYEAAKTQYDKTCEAIQYRKARSRQMDSFIKELRNQDLIKEFDARLWGSLVDFITVYSKDDIRMTFKDGTEIRA